MKGNLRAFNFAEENPIRSRGVYLVNISQRLNLSAVNAMIPGVLRFWSTRSSTLTTLRIHTIWNITKMCPSLYLRAFKGIMIPYKNLIRYPCRRPVSNIKLVMNSFSRVCNMFVIEDKCLSYVCLNNSNQPICIQ